MKQIGNRLRTLRESLSFSQAKLAELLGITQSSLNRYENGQSTPSVDLLRKYADFFDVSIDYILPVVTSHRESCITINRKYGKTQLRWSSSSRCALILNHHTTTA